jgi:hypothetical protein
LDVYVVLNLCHQPRYRAPKHARGVTDASYGFLDGDFLEQFLGNASLHKQILAGQSCTESLIMPASEILEIVETLQSMH